MLRTVVLLLNPASQDYTYHNKTWFLFVHIETATPDEGIMGSVQEIDKSVVRICYNKYKYTQE